MLLRLGRTTCPLYQESTLCRFLINNCVYARILKMFSYKVSPVQLVCKLLLTLNWTMHGRLKQFGGKLILIRESSSDM